MCNKSVDCPTCDSIETCAAVAAAFPTRAEEAAAKRSKRIPNTMCTAPGCTSPKAKGSTCCLLHKRARNRQYASRKAARHVA